MQQFINNRIFPFILVIVLQVIAISLADINGDIKQGALYAARWSARAGFPIFLAIFTASAIYKFYENTSSQILVKYRRQWGLAFALSHVIHFIFIIYFLRIEGHAFSIENLGVGLIPYALIAVMALTSNDASMRLLGRQWKRLHWVGIYSIWIGYSSSYFERMLESDSFIVGIIGSILSIIAIMLRITAHYKAKFQT